MFRDGRTLAELRRVTYDGEGWGLCHDRARGRLMMSEGSATLSLRNPQSFELLGRITVRDGDGPVSGLNELECTGTDVWANELFQCGHRSGDDVGAHNGQGSPAVEGGFRRLNSLAQEPCWFPILPHSTCLTPWSSG
ncbi:glutaminyl-peptide cyclotransferase [Streptomyces sp. R28]|uniref:Glutaminyl-peptide cyclotransferase n=1 Tax=Streptomyces sp. R28 TaxID=3238628 RepID=A0AB39QDV2_9ACTN